MNKLAIIIPAYKPDYLEETLESLTKQTNKDFKIYIGDDASPFYLENIVELFIDTLFSDVNISAIIFFLNFIYFSN